MRAVVTRVRSASVEVEGKLHGKIGKGFLVLLGIGPEDDEQTSARLAEKICRLRVFEDGEGKMNLDLESVGGELLVVSQFTLYADLGSRRPGFSHAAPPSLAEPLYNCFMDKLKEKGFPPQHGSFGADMQVESINDGPVTLLFDTDEMRKKK